MAKIECNFDTDTCQMVMNKDGEYISHDELVIGSYFLNEPMDGGSPSSYFPTQYSYFSYSKKSDDGTMKDKIHATFQVGKPGTYKETATQHNLAKTCADENVRVKTAISLGSILKAITNKFKKS